MTLAKKNYMAISESMLDKKLSYGRETAQSLILFQLTSSVIRKIMHKIGFSGHPIVLYCIV